MKAEQESPSRWLEWLLVLSCVTLVFQLFPVLFWGLLYVVDIRNWSWTAMSLILCVIIVILFAYRAWIKR